MIEIRSINVRYKLLASSSERASEAAQNQRSRWTFAEGLLWFAVKKRQVMLIPYFPEIKDGLSAANK